MIENNIISDHFTVKELKKLKITSPDAKMYKKIRSNWDSVAKPLDGMGDFELSRILSDVPFPSRFHHEPAPVRQSDRTAGERSDAAYRKSGFRRGKHAQ